MNSKYSKLLTIILVVAIIIVVILFVFFGIQIYKQYYVEKQQTDMSEIFDSQVSATNVTTNPQNPTNTNTTTSNEVVAPVITDNENPTGQGTQGSSGGSGSSAGIKYKGYTMVGKIEIPKIKANYPILAKTSKGAIEVAVSVLYGPGPNQPGVTVIVGHNYKNGTLFSNNKKLEAGDEIYITDTAGNRMKYIIYDKQLLAPEDMDYAQKDTQGAREIALSTCTDDVNSRLVLLAREG